MNKTQKQLGFDQETTKKYWIIGEVMEMFGITDSQIRYWETEFDQLIANRTRHGTRMFTKENIEVIGMIYHLIHEKGFTTEGAKKYLKERPDLLVTKIHTINSLKKIKEFLEEMKNKL